MHSGSSISYTGTPGHTGHKPMERFWRTLKEDLITETDFDSMEEFRDELMQYMLYYNQQKPHQGIMGKTPA